MTIRMDTSDVVALATIWAWADEIIASNRPRTAVPFVDTTRLEFYTRYNDMANEFNAAHILPIDVQIILERLYAAGLLVSPVRFELTHMGDFYGQKINAARYEGRYITSFTVDENGMPTDEQ